MLYELAVERQVENDTFRNSEKINIDLGLAASSSTGKERIRIKKESTQDKETLDEEEPSALEKETLRRGRMAGFNANLC